MSEISPEFDAQNFIGIIFVDAIEKRN